jgi:hypothetical protein
MEIKYVNNGRVDHVENHLARALINAGIAEAVEPPKAEPPTPRWRVILTRERRELVIELKHGTAVYYYGSSPEQINERLTWEGGGRWKNFPLRCPEEICDQYGRAWEMSPEARVANVLWQETMSRND